jgi:hypothetical protein
MASVKNRTPPIFRTAVAAWRDTWGAVYRMPLILGLTVAVLIPLDAAGMALLDRLFLDPLNPLLLIAELGTCAVQAALLAPLAIAVHRYVLLNERCHDLQQVIWNGRFLQFVAYAFAFNILGEVSVLLALLSSGDQILFTLILLIFVFLVAVLAIKVGLRTVILFPAIAVEARGAGWLNAIKDTTGHGWRVLLVLICTSIPILLLEIALLWYEPIEPLSMKLLVAIAHSVLLALWIGLLAAAASYLFLAYSNRLGRPPNLRSATSPA